MHCRRQLISVLAQLVGNRIYLDDLEKLFSRIDLTPQEVEALRYLARDLQLLSWDASRTKREPWRP